MKLTLAVLLLCIVVQAQKLSDDAKYRILQSFTHGTAVLAELQQAQADACKSVPACKAKLDEFQVAQKAYADLISKESKVFPEGTTLTPDTGKMDVVVVVPKSEKKTESPK